jgi:hypothetical protein
VQHKSGSAQEGVVIEANAEKPANTLIFPDLNAGNIGYLYYCEHTASLWHCFRVALLPIPQASLLNPCRINATYPSRYTCGV